MILCHQKGAQKMCALKSGTHKFPFSLELELKVELEDGFNSHSNSMSKMVSITLPFAI